MKQFISLYEATLVLVGKLNHATSYLFCMLCGKGNKEFENYISLVLLTIVHII